MDKDNIFSYRQQFNLVRDDYEPAKNLKTMANSVLQNRAKTFNHLEKFYMPIMKKAFEDSKSTHPSLPSPDEVLFSSRLLEIKQKQDKNVIESLRKQVQVKNNKILRLENELKSLQKNLLVFNIPTSDKKYDDPYNNLRKVESYLNIKNEQSLFQSKTRVNSLLQQFNISYNTRESIGTKTTERELINFIVSKLEPIAQQYKSLLNGNFQKRNQLQNKSIQLQYENKQLKQSFDIIKNAEFSLRQQLQHIKQNWNKSNNKIIYLQKQIEQKDTELYRFRKLLEQKKQSIETIHKQASQKVSLETNIRMDHETQTNELILLYQASCIENLEMKKQLQKKQFQLAELKAAYEFRIQEVDNLKRLNITLKSRYEPEDKNDICYSPRTYHEKQAYLLKDVKSISQLNQRKQYIKQQQLRQNLSQHVRISNQYLPPKMQKHDSNKTDFSYRHTGKLRLQKIVEIKNEIQQKQYQLWMLSHPSKRQNRDQSLELEQVRRDIQRLTNQMTKLQNDFPLEY